MIVAIWDIKEKFREITDHRFQVIKDTKAKGLNEKEFFDCKWDALNETFKLDTGRGQLLKIEYSSDKDDTLQFLKIFTLWNLDVNLKFHMDYENGSADIYILGKDLDDDKLIEILNLLYAKTGNLFQELL